MVPGNVGGMTWSGYAFDPQHSLLVTNTNNIVAGARLIPRVKYDQRGSHDEDGEYGDQTGVPYGLFRRFLQSPSDLPCSAPPWGLLTAVDMNEGTIAGRFRSARCKISAALKRSRFRSGR